MLLGILTLHCLSSTPPARALDIKAEEKAALKVCEKRFCGIVLGQDAGKPADFQCRLSKTWTKRNIKDNVDGKTSAWSLGDARCTADVTLARLAILDAMSAGKHNVEFAPHTVHCEVENGGHLSVIDVTLAPKIEFRDGKARKAWIKLKAVEGPPTWKATLWTLAKIEDTLGLFQRDVLKAIDKLVGQTCPATYATPAPREIDKRSAHKTGAATKAPDKESK